MRTTFLVFFLLVSSLCHAQVANTQGFLQSRAGTTLLPVIAPPHYDIVLQTAGDSISRDQASTNYIFILWTNILNGVSLYAQPRQRGINGISWNYRWPSEPYTNTMIQDGPIIVDPDIRYGETNWLVAFAGTNGIGLAAHSAATEYADFQTWLAARLAAGWSATNIVVCTMLPRTGVSNTTRGTYNTNLVNGVSTYGYRMARLDLDPNIGCNGCDTNTTYFYDGTHPTVAGHVIIATIIYSAMYP